MLQPLLLLKQTLEAPYDPGPLLLNGPNVKFTSARQFFPAVSETGRSMSFVVTIGMCGGSRFAVGFDWKDSYKKFDVSYNYYESNNKEVTINN